MEVAGAKALIHCDSETAGLKACSTLMQLHFLRAEAFFKRMPGMGFVQGLKPKSCLRSNARLKPCSSTLRGKRVEALAGQASLKGRSSTQPNEGLKAHSALSPAFAGSAAQGRLCSSLWGSDLASPRSLRPTRALVGTRARFTTVGMTNRVGTDFKVSRCRGVC
jgi:hypothetical protein